MFAHRGPLGTGALEFDFIRLEHNMCITSHDRFDRKRPLSQHNMSIKPRNSYTASIYKHLRYKDLQGYDWHRGGGYSAHNVSH